MSEQVIVEKRFSEPVGSITVYPYVPCIEKADLDGVTNIVDILDLSDAGSVEEGNGNLAGKALSYDHITRERLDKSSTDIGTVLANHGYKPVDEKGDLIVGEETRSQFETTKPEPLQTPFLSRLGVKLGLVKALRPEATST